MSLPKFSEWVRIREGINAVYGAAFDPVGADWETKYPGLPSKNKTFDGDDDALINLGRKRPRGRDAAAGAVRKFGFRREDPVPGNSVPKGR